MNILLLNADRSSTLPLDELLLVWPNRYELLCSAVSRGAQPALAGAIAERDPEAGRRFIKRLNKILEMEQCSVKRAKAEVYRSPVLSGIARSTAHGLLGEME